SRLEKNGKIIVIASRLHEADLSGMLLEQQAAGGDEWTVIEMPALNEAGQALWPEKYDVPALERIRSNITTFDWEALYQQQPIHETGSYFREQWLKPYVDDPPLSSLNVYGGSDYAVTANGGDYTVHAVVGVDPKNRMFLLDLWRQQASSAIWIDAFC